MTTSRAIRRKRLAAVLGSVLVPITGVWLYGTLAGNPARASNSGAALPLATTSNDFFQPGTQPLMSDFAPLSPASQCSICHGQYEEYSYPKKGDDPDDIAFLLLNEPQRLWASTLLGQSARDPVFWAALSVANQAADGVGEFCMRCHVPNAFIGGTHVPADGSGLQVHDMDGVSCDICHRMVDPVYKAGISPAADFAILAALEAKDLIPPQGSNGRFIIDPFENRRGPYDPATIPFNPHFGTPGFPPPEMYESPLHMSSDLCWTCHDVSNPIMIRQSNGSYALGDLDTPHPTHDHFEMFPLHRTFSEWENSYYFVLGGVQHNGRFGGDHPTGIMHSCQDCHMPIHAGFGCGLPGFPFRDDLRKHGFAGANTWVIRAVHDLFPPSETGLDDDLVEASVARNRLMLQAAADLHAIQYGTTLRTRITNQSGHKLPTGFSDGRRMWMNLRYLDQHGELIAERGSYDYATHTLEAEDTVVFEASLGLDEDLAAQLGVKPGKTFNFVLANTVLKDNRIPPRGFSNQKAALNQTTPVGATYLNGQHWYNLDDSIPPGAASVVATLYHQVTTREYIEFLRDENVTDNRGQIAYDMWVLHQGGTPTVMNSLTIQLTHPADFDNSGTVDSADLLLLLNNWGPCTVPAPFCIYDLNGDGVVDSSDLLILLANWS